MTKTIYDTMERLGETQRQRAVLPQVAMNAMQAAIDGKVTADDANDLYAAYLGAARGLAIESTADPSFKANASKLRQIIAMASRYRTRSMDIVTCALTLRVKLEREGEPMLPAYAALVNVARAQLKAKRPLSKKALAAAMRK